jgi:Ca2+-dependent lipid-binding protein
VLKGKIYINTELFGEMDPFVIIEYKGSKHQTKTIDEGGANPVWNQALKFPIET